MKPWFLNILEAYEREFRSSQDSLFKIVKDKYMAQHYSLNVANNMGSATRAPILIPSEYPHWATRMSHYLKRLGKEVWRSVQEGPHVPTTTLIQNNTTEALGGGAVARPTAADLVKMDADE